jgi:transcriptional regulator with XRE-family HTH domain
MTANAGTAAPREATKAEFGEALKAVRRGAGLKQHQLAAALELSTRTLVRWERGLAMPRVDVRDTIVAWLRARTGREADRALEALGVRFVRATAAPSPGAPLSPEAAERAKLAIEHALYKAAEAGDVTARTARQIALGVLAAVEAAGVSAAAARGLLAE